MEALVTLLLALFPPAPPNSVECGAERGVTLQVLDLGARSPNVLSFSCDASGDCAVEITLRLTNCSAGPVQLTRVDSPEAKLDCSFLENGAALTLEAGHARTFWCAAQGEGAVTLLATTTAAGAGETPLPPVRLRLEDATARDAKLEAERARYKACHGEWGPHGKARTVHCDCPSRMGGRRCEDNADCKGGECLLDQALAKPVSESPAVGKCSPYEGHGFGCHWVVKAGKAMGYLPRLTTARR
jgi:hypothetical protein